MNIAKTTGIVCLTTLITAISLVGLALGEDAASKQATEHTKEANARVLEGLPFHDQSDFLDARRGLIARKPGLIIRDGEGRSVWNMDEYSFLEADSKAPDTVNPSLWRVARLNSMHGLFKVVDRVYQVRGYDLSNVSFIQTDSGYIVVDPLTSAEAAKAAWDLVRENLGDKPIVAVVVTHSHGDHFGGLRGILPARDADAVKIKIIAPEGFLLHAVSENLLAGNAMRRRSKYMYGTLLPKGPKAQVDSGLGKTLSDGTVGLIPPTHSITKTGEEMTIDGVRIVFQLTPDTEAPAEMCFYLPQFKALCMADLTGATMLNLLTMRGAPVRDAKAWSHHINEALRLFGSETEVVFTGHNWPRWGKEKVADYLKRQRDLYKYIHDQTLRLANKGHTMAEIGEMIALPDTLAKEWSNRDYYGTLNHNAKAVYQKYLGWFEGNPAHLHPLPSTESGRKYMEFMGGAAAVIEKARESYSKGEYRWVVEVMNHLVFADPQNKQARELQADAMEQLGYQAESAVWRNFYLTAAMELRHGVPNTAKRAVNADALKALPISMFLDYLAIRLNGPKAAGKKLTVNLKFTDPNEAYVLSLENAVLSHEAGQQDETADAGITLSRTVFHEILLSKWALMKRIAAGDIKLQGNKLKLIKFFSLFDKFDPSFNVVTPRSTVTE
ncbi:MAG: alkyl sulfatase dimerization domain-containing protein [Thermodesulfobacteriota bacterium]